MVLTAGCVGCWWFGLLVVWASGGCLTAGGCDGWLLMVLIAGGVGWLLVVLIAGGFCCWWFGLLVVLPAGGFGCCILKVEH